MVKKGIKIALLVLVILVVLLGVFFALALLTHPKGTHEEVLFTEDTVFDDTQITYLSKDPSKEFTILNLTDIQFCDLEDLFHFNTIKNEIDALVEETDPDLITITGDLTWSNENNISLHFLIQTMESYEIPWAPIIGNHDMGNTYGAATASLDYFCDLLEQAPHCLFKRGPSNLGIGNYVLCIMEGGTLCHTIYMMDNGYVDEISEDQSAWFQMNQEGLIALYGESPCICMMHKPIPQYRYAWYNSTSEDEQVYVYCSLSGVDDCGFFDLAKSLGLTDVVCGHQHTNAFTLPYEGVQLTFALKTGELSFYYDDGEIYLNGGTVLKLDGTGPAQVSMQFVERGTYHIEGSTNQYAEE